MSLVCVSTTLATNAVVENRFSPVCTLLIGFDDAMIERSGLQRQGAGLVVRIAGGHGATGEETAPLDEDAVLHAVAQSIRASRRSRLPAISRCAIRRTNCARAS